MAPKWVRSSGPFVFLSVLSLIAPIVAQCNCSCPPFCVPKPGERFIDCLPEERLESRSEVQVNIIGLELCIKLGLPLLDCCPKPEPVTTTVVSVVVVTATSTITLTSTATVTTPVTQRLTDIKTETKLETRTAIISILVTEKQTQTNTETKVETRTATISIPVTEKQTQTKTETKAETRTLTTTATRTSIETRTDKTTATVRDCTATSVITKTFAVCSTLPSRTCTGPRETVTYAFDELSTAPHLPENYRDRFIEFPGMTPYNTSMGPPPSPWSEYYAIAPATNFTVLLAREIPVTIRIFDDAQTFDVHSIFITSTVSHLTSFRLRLIGQISFEEGDVVTTAVPKLLLPMQKCIWEPYDVNCERERVGMYKLDFKAIPGSWQNLSRLKIFTEEGVLLAIDALVVSRATGPCK